MKPERDIGYRRQSSEDKVQKTEGKAGVKENVFSALLQQWHSDDNRVFFPSSKGFKGDNFSTFISSRGFSLNRPTVNPLPQVDY